MLCFLIDILLVPTDLQNSFNTKSRLSSKLSKFIVICYVWSTVLIRSCGLEKVDFPAYCFVLFILTSFGLFIRDDPSEMPVLVAANAAAVNCTISPKGDNLFAAVK